MWAVAARRPRSRSLVSSSFSGRATSRRPPASATFRPPTPIPRRAGDHDAARRLVASSPERSALGDHAARDLCPPIAAARAARAVCEEVGVEVALPVVPELVGVGLQRRHRDAGALERLLGLARVEAGRVVDVDEHRARDAEVGEDLVGDPLHRRQHREPERDRLGDRSRASSASIRIAAAARGRRWAKMLITWPAVSGFGSVRWKAWPSSPSVGDVVHRLGHEVDRHDVDLLPSMPTHRHPRRQRRCAAAGSA